MCTELNEVKSLLEEIKDIVVDLGQIVMKQVESHDEKMTEVTQLLMGQIEDFEEKVSDKLDDIADEI